MMFDLLSKVLTRSAFATGIISLVSMASVARSEVFLQTEASPGLFPASAEVITGTPADGVFGDDADVSLAQSFTINSTLSLESLYLTYEYDTNFDGDQAVTMSIFSLGSTDVNAASAYTDPLDFSNALRTEAVTFPNNGGADTSVGIQLDSPLVLDPGGYILHFTNTTNPGWEWLRGTANVGSTYPDGRGYENGTEKGDDGRDFVLALSSQAFVDFTNSVQSGSLLAGTTWDNGIAPVGAPPAVNFVHTVVDGHAIDVDTSQAYNGIELRVLDGTLNYSASRVDLQSVSVAAGATVTESANGEFFLGDPTASNGQFGSMELNGQMNINAEGGANAVLLSSISGTGTATVNVEAGGVLGLTDMSRFQGTLRFDGTSDELRYEGPHESEMTIEMNSTGANRVSWRVDGFQGSASEIIFNESGTFDHATTEANQPGRRLAAFDQLTANADVEVDMTKEFTGRTRRLFTGLGGTGTVTVNGTATDPTNTSGAEVVSLNEFELGGTGEGASDTSSFTGTLVANDYINIEIRDQLSGGAIVVNQNALLDVGHDEVSERFSTRVGEVTVNNGGTLEVGYEELAEIDDTNVFVVGHVPHNLRLTTQRGASGDLNLEAGSKTVMQISGIGANQFDTITAEGTVTLGGELEVLIDPALTPSTTHATQGFYTPTDGDTFEIISAGAETLPGDYDASGVVDTADFDLWVSMFGNAFNMTADGNLDGIVDAADYAVWRESLGDSGSEMGSIVGDFSSMVIVDPNNVLAGFTVTKSVTTGVGGSVTLTINSISGAAASTPEPSSLAISALVAMAAGGLAARKRRFN